MTAAAPSPDLSESEGPVDRALAALSREQFTALAPGLLDPEVDDVAVARYLTGTTGHNVSGLDLMDWRIETMRSRLALGLRDVSRPSEADEDAAGAPE